MAEEVTEAAKGVRTLNEAILLVTRQVAIEAAHLGHYEPNIFYSSANRISIICYNCNAEVEITFSDNGVYVLNEGTSSPQINKRPCISSQVKSY